MKKVLTSILLCFSLPLFSQSEVKNQEIQIETGFLIHYHDLNNDGYFGSVFSNASLDPSGLIGFDIRVTMPTKIKNIDLSFGTIIEMCGDTYISSISDHKLNGGGVYVGISPKAKGKHFGLSSLFAIGVLSYKEYYHYYSTTPDPDVDIHDNKASFGLGAISSIGAYAKFGPVGIHPQVQAVFSGGSNASFLFYGFVIPLTVQF